jgi:hypothetical protein
MPLNAFAVRKWQRPYPLCWWHYLVGVILAIGIATFIGVAAKGLSLVGTDPAKAVEILSIDIAFCGSFFALAWRLLTMGIYVGSFGLRYRGPIRTRIVPWSELKGVRRGPLNVGTSLTAPTGAVTIWIDRKQGDSIQTHVNNQGADYLGRRKAFDATFGAIARSVDEHLGSPRP